MPALLESLRRAAPSGRLDRHQCNTLFRSFTQADATSTRRRLREHLRGRLRQSLQTPPTTDWAPTVAPGRWAGATPRPRACENPNRILATVRAPAPPSDDRRQLLDRTVYNDMPLCEQELARLYSHQNPVDSYLNDTLIDWNLAELLRGGEIPETSLVFGGRLMAMLHNSLPRGNTLNVRREDTQAVYNRMKRWLNGRGGARNVDPLARDMLFFLDNQAAGHWRLVVCVNPAALIAGQDDDAGVRAPAPPTPPGGVALEGPSADAHAPAPPPHLDAGARDSQGGDDSTHVPPQPPTATQSRWRPSQRRKCERCGQRMPAGHGQCRCYEWLDSDDSQAGGWDAAPSGYSESDEPDGEQTTWVSRTLHRARQAMSAARAALQPLRSLVQPRPAGPESAGWLSRWQFRPLPRRGDTRPALLAWPRGRVGNRLLHLSPTEDAA